MNNMYLRKQQALDKRQKRTRGEHETLIYETSLELVDAYDIFYDEGELISSNFHMADRIYNAAIELLEHVGVLFDDEDRVLELNRNEIISAIRNKKRSFKIGEGIDATTLHFRDVLDNQMPLIMGGPNSSPISFEMFVPIHRSYAKIGMLDSIAPGIIHEFPNSMLIKPFYELYSVHEAASNLKQACNLEGRSGLCCVSPPFVEDIRASISIANSNSMGTGDFQEFYPRPDLTATNDEIVRAVHYKMVGLNYLCTHSVIMGGMTSASAGQFAIELVAEAIKSNVLYSGIFFKNPTNVQLPTSTTLNTLWASFMSSIALSRNIHIPYGNVIRNSAGPCTKMSFYETAVQTIGSVVCGDDIVAGPILNNGSMVDHAAGLESQFMAEIAELATTLSLEDANLLCLQLFSKYKNKIKKVDTGKTFSECYDITTLEPSAEYRTKYDEVIKEIYGILTDGIV
ncbi:monomethylamine:corrinoid methyltransferase [Methanococcoides sp. LMO-2]|uniref:[methylamine--corrinoid protein] Co-methyltransferase n=1 Tax=Methanococcoides cohabitans TaxID=3136559 RepID=A0ABU9KUI3_9EURY